MYKVWRHVYNNPALRGGGRRLAFLPRLQAELGLAEEAGLLYTLYMNMYIHIHIHVCMYKVWRHVYNNPAEEQVPSLSTVQRWLKSHR